MQTILCLNTKGGCGKTTLATNLAAWYADAGQKVALADHDPQKSTLDWLQARQDYEGIPNIHGIDASGGELRSERGTDKLIIDAAAGTAGKALTPLLRKSNVVLVPVLPSPTDMRAAARFLQTLADTGRVKKGQTKVAIVENRVRENSRIFQVLEQFLSNYPIPVVTHLRESQNYIKAAETGLGLFELAPSSVVQDVQSWDPLIEWLEAN